MGKNENFQFEFEDIYSSLDKTKHGFEDISSTSKKNGRHFSKKKRGIAAFFAKIAEWWRNRKTWQKALTISGVSIFLIFAILFGVVRIFFDYNYNKITDNNGSLGFENVIDKKIINVALFGIDTRTVNSFKGLSDSIMILSVNTETKKIKLISIMRDSLVPITHNGKTTYTKINSAYSKGGPELAIKTINTAFGLDISEYATVNFYGMADIIDAVGGIDVDVSAGEIDVFGYENGRRVNWGINGTIAEICGYLKVDKKDYLIKEPGLQHMNGIQAVGYARVRHAANAQGSNDDYGRTDRQRYVMEQLFNKALTLKKSQYPKFAKSLIPCTETSLSYTEIIGLAADVLLKNPTFEQTRVPFTEYQMSNPKTGGSYVYYDINFAQKLIHAFIYDDIKPEDYIEQNGIEKNDWYSERVGGSSSKKPSTSKPSNSKPQTTSSNSSSSEGTTTEPSEPTESSNPSEPSEPTESSEPSAPSESSDVSSSSKPSQPSQPNVPDGTQNSQ